MLNEISQLETDKYHMISLICGIYEQIEQRRKIRTDSQIESRMIAGGRWGRGGGGQIEEKGKRTHGHGQQCGDCWLEGG